MTFVIQTQVILPTRPGALEGLCRAIAEANVNIQAVMVRDDVDFSTVRLVLDRPKLGREVLEQHGFSVTESKIISVLLPDQPGELWKVSAALAAHNINIQYSYTAAKSVRNRVAVLLAVGGVPPERAAEILGEEGYECLDHAGLAEPTSPPGS